MPSSEPIVFCQGVAIEALEGRRLFSGGVNGFVTQTNLVSDGFVSANHLDPQLKNPWGVSFQPGGPLWVSDNNSGVSTFYDATGVEQGVVAIPGGDGGSGNPTGQVFNPGPGFPVTKNGVSGPANFIFVGEDGGISGWNPSVDPNNAVIAVNNAASGAVYKGATLGVVNGKTELFAANFHGGTIEAYDDAFSLVQIPGGFHDRRIPKGFAPFNVQDINGQLYVTYAKQDVTGQNDVGGAGNGFVNVYDTGGRLLHRLQHGQFLDSPWGVATAPSTWGRFAGDILVGQFKSGQIALFNPRSGSFLGMLRDQSNKPVQIDHLWALTSGSGSPLEGAGTLYFTAGLNAEADGLFGTVTFTPAAKPHLKPRAHNPPAHNPAPTGGMPTPTRGFYG